MESRMRKANKLNLMKSVETCLQDCNGSDCLRCVVQTDASTLSSECKMTNSLYAWLLFGLFNLCAHHKTAVRLLNGFNTFCHCYRILRWISFTPQMDCKKTTHTQNQIQTKLDILNLQRQFELYWCLLWDYRVLSIRRNNNIYYFVSSIIRRGQFEFWSWKCTIYTQIPFYWQSNFFSNDPTVLCSMYFKE